MSLLFQLTLSSERHIPTGFGLVGVLSFYNITGFVILLASSGSSTTNLLKKSCRELSKQRVVNTRINVCRIWDAKVHKTRFWHIASLKKQNKGDHNIHAGGHSGWCHWISCLFCPAGNPLSHPQQNNTLNILLAI